MKKIGVVDYGSGNLRSVCKAFEAAGAEARLVTRPADLETAGAVVVPGVGAFADCANHLRASELWEPLKSWIVSGKPYLGICLGYQILFESSEESPGVEGLGVLPGHVQRFSDLTLKVPHMGWSNLSAMNGPLYRDLPDGTSVYFVHSYYPVPADPASISATCEYGTAFAASVSLGALHATQFHPEKSQAVGLRILGNFLSTL